MWIYEERYRLNDGETQRNVVCILASRSLSLNGEGDIGARWSVEGCQEGHCTIIAISSFNI